MHVIIVKRKIIVKMIMIVLKLNRVGHRLRVITMRLNRQLLVLRRDSQRMHPRRQDLLGVLLWGESCKDLCARYGESILLCVFSLQLLMSSLNYSRKIKIYSCQHTHRSIYLSLIQSHWSTYAEASTWTNKCPDCKSYILPYNISDDYWWVALL